jgi:hypothetical protein
MTIPPFDLGLTEADELAIAAARRRPVPFDRDAALRMVQDSSALVQAAVRRRPLLTGEPFELPGHEERSS